MYGRSGPGSQWGPGHHLCKPGRLQACDQHPDQTGRRGKTGAEVQPHSQVSFGAIKLYIALLPPLQTTYKIFLSIISLVNRVSDVRQFVVGARPLMAATEFVLITTFPNKELTDESQSLQDANLLNAVIVQRLKWWSPLVAWLVHSSLIPLRDETPWTYGLLIPFFSSIVIRFPSSAVWGVNVGNG